jgi:hypothetical protein
MTTENTGRSRRVVFEHQSGLREIVGLVSAIQDTEGKYPSELTNVAHMGRVVNVKLAKVEPTYVLYRET